MQLRSSISAAAAAFAASAALVQPASAHVVVTLRDVSSGVTRSCDTSAAVSAFNCGPGFTVLGTNNVAFAGYVGTLKVTNLSAISNAPGTPTDATLALRYDVLNTANFTRQLLVDFAGLGYTLPLGPVLRTQSATSVVRYNAAPSVFTERVYVDPTNSAALAIGMGCSIPVASAGCGTAMNWARGAGPYSQRLLDSGLLGAGSAVTVSTRVHTKPL